MEIDLIKEELREKYGDQKILEWERDREIMDGNYNEDDCKEVKMVAKANVNGKNMKYVGWIEDKPTINELIKEDLKEELYN